MKEWVLFNGILGFCVLVFAAIGLWALLRKTPMHFWSGTTVEPEEITDVKKYNKANAVMWFCYCIPQIISMLIAPFSVSLATIVMVAGILGGLPVLIIVYKKIYNKYKR